MRISQKKEWRERGTAGLIIMLENQRTSELNRHSSESGASRVKSDIKNKRIHEGFQHTLKEKENRGGCAGTVWYQLVNYINTDMTYLL